ncbi:E3 SUMO-protein ligase ZBED1-like [Sardina pilchardus]|uniref:E3 SUMO-protein ligase ZBED1-like n=1 Tax=Sardina pilchardus TaxID=27697 RepID=UPI002E0D1F28
MDASTSSKLTQAIAKWIATSCRPVYVVEDEGLCDIIRIASGDLTYELPSRATVMSRIHEWYDTEKAKLATNLENTTSIALTGDYWTSLGNHSYLGVTAHFIDQEWKLHSHALTVMRTDDRHTANACADHFMDVAGQWNIQERVSTLNTDSARNMIAASKQLPFEHLPCTAHSIQRSVTVSLQNSTFEGVLAKCRKVVGHFKHSPPNTAELQKQQVAHGLKAETLAQDVPTRWNSTLEMIKRVQRNQEPLRDVLAQQKNNVTMPTKAELEKLQKLELLLEPCRYFTELLGGEKFVSCSVVLPALCHLSRVMETSEDDPTYVIKFKQTFSADMTTRKDKTNLTWLKISTALDPRSDEEEDGVENCLARYRAEPVICKDECPLEWWSKHACVYNKIACLAQKYLATPATSVPCERLFSLSGHVVQKKRAALSSGNVTKLVCLSSWLWSTKEKV